MRQTHTSELIGVISVHRSVLGLWKKNLIMRDRNSFPCKAEAATESHYQQPYVELQVPLVGWRKNCVKLKVQV